MNKIYKLKQSRNANGLIAVAEIASNTVAESSKSPLDEQYQAITSGKTISNKLHALASRFSHLSLLTTTTLALAFGGTSIANANSGLTGSQVVTGQATITTDGSTTTIVNSPNTIINWQSFSINKNELVEFIQESANSAVLNRVLGSDVTSILGTLKSNGKVFVVNPNGLVVGNGAVVDTASFVGSTLNITNDDFTAGSFIFNQDKNKAIATVLNQGLITVKDDASLALIGGNVVNNGVLEARNGSVYLLAGQQIQIADLNNPLVSFKVTAGNKALNLGDVVSKNTTVVANAVAHGTDNVGTAFTDLYSTTSARSSKLSATGEVTLYAGSVADQLQSTNQTDTQVVGERNSLALVNAEIDVVNKTGKAGSIKVLSDVVYLGDNAVLNASGNQGGAINVGGDLKGTGDIKLSKLTTVDNKAVISVAGHGDAGKAIFWGDDLYVDGSFDATSVIGKGGFVETSGKGLTVKEGIHVSTKSQSGQGGEWLLDPSDLLIYTEEQKNQPGAATTEANTGSATDYFNYGERGANNYRHYVLNKTLEAKLNDTNVTLLAQNFINASDLHIHSTNTTTQLTLHTIAGTFNNVSVQVGNFKIVPVWYTGGFKFVNSTLQITNGFYVNGTTSYGVTGSNHNLEFDNITLTTKVIDIDIGPRDFKIFNSTITTTGGGAKLAGGIFLWNNATLTTAGDVDIKLVGVNPPPYGNTTILNSKINTSDTRYNVTIKNNQSDANYANFSNVSIDAKNLTTIGSVNISESKINTTENWNQKDNGSLKVLNSNTSIGKSFVLNSTTTTKPTDVLINTTKVGSRFVVGTGIEGTNDGNFTVNGSIDATNGPVNISSAGNVSFSNGTINATEFNVTSGNLLSTFNYSVNATGDIKLTENNSTPPATAGIQLTDSKFFTSGSGKFFNISTTSAPVTVNNNNITASSINVCATDGANIALAFSNLTATSGELNLNVGNATLTNSNFS